MCGSITAQLIKKGRKKNVWSIKKFNCWQAEFANDLLGMGVLWGLFSWVDRDSWDSY